MGWDVMAWDGVMWRYSTVLSDCTQASPLEYSHGSCPLLTPHASLRMPQYLLLTTYCSLLTTYCLLPTPSTCCLLLTTTTHCLLLTTTTHYLLLTTTTYYLLLTTWVWPHPMLRVFSSTCHWRLSFDIHPHTGWAGLWVGTGCGRHEG